VAALEAGEINIADLITPLDLLSLEGSSGFETLVGNVAGLPFSMMFNTTRGPFQDIRVRKAFMHAVDRPRLAENLFFGFADAAYGPLSASTPHYWAGAEQTYPYNPEGAMALLEEAGWVDSDGDGIREKDGETLSLFFPSLLEPDTAVAVQAEVAKVGFDLQVENVLKARQDELIFANDYDILVIRWVSNDPGVLIIPFHSRNIPTPGNFKFNWARFADAELDQQLEDAEAATSDEERGALYEAIQKRIMDEAIFYPLHNQVQMIGYTSDMTGFHFAPGNWQVRFYDVSTNN
jgi:peptide/nickel transport system substrate-binding protein